MMRARSKEQDLEGAMQVSLAAQGAELDHVVVFRKESYRKCSVCSWLGSSGRCPVPRGACKVFRKLQSSGVQLTSLVYNALLDSCVQCGKVASAFGCLARSVWCRITFVLDVR